MSQPAQAVDEEQGLRYLSAAEVPSEKIVRLLSESLAREPMAAALGVPASDLAPCIRRFMPECTSNGLSVVAVRDDDPDTVVAAFLSRDFKSPLPEGIPEDLPMVPAGGPGADDARRGLRCPASAAQARRGR
jgi:hypothetical protein